MTTYELMAAKSKEDIDYDLLFAVTTKNGLQLLQNTCCDTWNFNQQISLAILLFGNFLFSSKLLFEPFDIK